MKQFPQLTLASAIALTLAGGMGAAFQASANPALDINTAPTPSAIWDETAQTGDVLLFPYYTVRDDANGNPLLTTFTVTNTGDKTLVLKFRLRDSKNSDDVLDFIWIMSPRDEVVAYMDRTADGTPRVNFPADENSCRVPFGKSSYTASKGDVPNLAASQEGHIEVIPMAALDPNSTYGAMAVHDQSKNPPLPANCAELNKLFGGLAKDGSTSVNTEALLRSTLAASGKGGASAVGNVLRGSYTITAQASGFSGGGAAMALSDWDDEAWARTGTAQGLLFFQLGSMTATSTLPDGYDNKQYYHPHLGDSSATLNGGGKAIASALDFGSIAAATVANNWSVNPGNGVGTDWVVTFPTKYLYRTSRIQKTVDGLKQVDSEYAAPFDVLDSKGLARCVETQVTLYNREEGTVQGGGAIISPSPSDDPTYLCNEVNVLSFSNGGAFNPVLRAKDDLDMLFDTSDVVQPYGWAKLSLINLGSGVSPVAIDGFAFTRRNIGVANTAFGSIVPHTLMDNNP